jgi:hypothetical protein
MQKEKPGFEVIPNWNQIESRTALKSAVAADQHRGPFWSARRLNASTTATAVAAPSASAVATTTIASTSPESASASTSAKVAAAAIEAA